MFVEPEPGVFNYTEGDIVVSIAAKSNKYLRCHALVWHNQLAPWVENTTWTPETLTAAIERHITGAMTHWKGKCYAWDVVNEALEDDGSYRKSLFYNVLGEEYLRIAFRTAAAVDPAAKLYYNDYGIERPGSVKAEGAKRLVKMIQDAGLRIDGLGLQAHFHADTHPSAADNIKALESLSTLGVELAYTELDMRIPLPVNETSLGWQAQGYSDVSLPWLVDNGIFCAIANACRNDRSRKPVSRSRPASASPYGTFTTPSAGSSRHIPVRGRLSCGLRTSANIPPTTRLLKHSRSSPLAAANAAGQTTRPEGQGRAALLFGKPSNS